MNPTQRIQIEAVAGDTIVKTDRLAGGMISAVLKLRFAKGSTMVAKIGNGSHDLSIEGFMLDYLREHSPLPVPQVFYADADMLLMQHIEGENSWNAESLAHLAKLLAHCHQITADSYGLQRDTLAGPLHQPNTQSTSWIAFFRDLRLRYMVAVARQSGHLPVILEERLLSFADEVHALLIEPDRPALIHGDMWRTNVIVRADRVVGIIDPAMYYAHYEMELAYMTLFDGVGAEFFQSYQQVSPIDPEFFSQRRHIYNLYPLLIHLTIFGEKYIQPLESSLARFGF